MGIILGKVRRLSEPPLQSNPTKLNSLNERTGENTESVFSHKWLSTFQIDPKQIEPQVSCQIPPQPDIARKVPSGIEACNPSFSVNMVLHQKIVRMTRGDIAGSS